MTVAAQKIEKEIQQLSLEDMLALHVRLLASIDERESAQKLDPAYADQIRRRIWEIDSGKVDGADAFQALNEM
jgi:hypothetical protein